MASRDTEPLKQRKQPAQARSRDLVEAVLVAAARILREQGEDALTTARICEVAGVSPGSLYQYFPTKDAVIYAILRQHAEVVTVAMTGVLAEHRDSDAATLIGAAVHAFVDAHRTDPAVHAAIGRHVARLAGPGLEEDLLSGAERVLRAILEQRQAELRVSPDVGAFLLMRTLEGAVHAAARDRADLLEDPEFSRGLELLLRGLVTPA